MRRRSSTAPDGGLRRWWIVVVVAALSCYGQVGCYHGEAHHLSAMSRWVVRQTGRRGTAMERVKLACVNWAAHLEPMLAEGLHRQPIHRTAKAVKAMGFNCVRLTWATYMMTRGEGSATAAERLRSLNLTWQLRGLEKHNPVLVNATVAEAFATVAGALGREGLYVVADNHVSKPGWKGEDDGQDGFWGDALFGAQEWLRGVSAMANLSLSVPYMAAISLRNELNGAHQNVPEWTRFMSMAAEAVFALNPDLLIIISGLHSDTDLHFLSASSPLAHLPFQHKLAYELHWYESSYGSNFGKGNLNQACAVATSSIAAAGAFMVAANSSAMAAPLLISEFGMDQRGGKRGEERYMRCAFALMAGMDMDWSYWALQGSYYTRNGREEDEEYMGILNGHWNATRNPGFMARLQAIQQPWRGFEGNSSSAAAAAMTPTYHILFHPASASCLLKGPSNSLLLGPCTPSTTHWRHSPQGRLEMLHSFLCIAARGEGQEARLEVIGTEENGAWKMLSAAKLQWGTKIRGNNGTQAKASSWLCLDGRNAPAVTTERCVCVQVDGMDCGREDDPSTQWFVLVSANVNPRGKHVLQAI